MLSSGWSEKFMTNPVNLNLDSIERLKSLPGVGEILASVIIEKRRERPWTRKNLAELDRPGRASALLLPLPIVRFFYLDQKSPTEVVMAPKLTKQHVQCSSFDKLSVSPAGQTLSNAVANQSSHSTRGDACRRCNDCLVL